MNEIAEAEVTVKSKNLNEVTNNFVTHLESLAETFPTVLTILGATTFKTANDYNDFLTEECELTDDQNKTYQIPESKLHRWKTLKRKLENSRQASEIVLRSFLVSLVSEYDAYLGHLIRCIFYLKPEILNSSEKNLTFSKLVEFDNIEDARDYLIEKEVESVLRESHISHFKWLENKLDIKLTSDLPSWSRFIELTERRNLFVHADGVVSSHYLSICKTHNISLTDEIKLGTRLTIDKEYFFSAYRCILEIGIKLSQVIWRKLIPEEKHLADNAFITIIFDQINREDYKLAIELAEFSTHKVIKHFNDEIRLTCIINKAQAYKWDGQIEKCKSIIKQIDWSAYSDKFKLVSHVLLDEFENAASAMKRIGNNPDILRKEQYKTWPIFMEFRNSQVFKNVYKEIFNEEFDSLVSETKEIGDLEN